MLPNDYFLGGWRKGRADASSVDVLVDCQVESRRSELEAIAVLRHHVSDASPGLLNRLAEFPGAETADAAEHP